MLILIKYLMRKILGSNELHCLCRTANNFANTSAIHYGMLNYYTKFQFLQASTNPIEKNSNMK